MPFPLAANRVRETTTTTGSGTFTLGGAVAGFQPFSVIGSGSSCIYSASAGSEFEVGVGTWASGLLTREEILDSSQSGAKVNFSAGTKSLFITQAAQSVWNGFEEPGGRLSLTTGVPVTTSEVTAASTLYYTPYIHSGIKLWTGSCWRWFTLSADLSVSLSSITIGRLYDVFAYPSGSSAALELVAWNDVTTGSITAASNATPITITSTSHGLAVWDVVNISGVGGNTAANGTWRVASVPTANTFTITTLANVNSVGNGTYTSGGTWRKISQTSATRASAITRVDGAWTLSSDKTRLLLGTIRGSASGQCEDSLSKRLVGNVFHRQPRPLRILPSTYYWIYASNGSRPAEDNLANRFEFACPLSDVHARVESQILVYASAGGLANNHFFLNAAGGAMGNGAMSAVGTSPNGTVNSLLLHVAADTLLAGGYNFIQWCENSDASTTFSCNLQTLNVNHGRMGMYGFVIL